MSEGHSKTVRYERGALPKSESDWARADAFTDEELYRTPVTIPTTRR